MPFKPVENDALSYFAPKTGAGLTEHTSADISKFKDRVDLRHVSPLYQDVADIAAFNQTATEKWLNGAIKAVYTAGTTALDPFISLSYGIGESIFKGLERGNYEFADIYNNSITKGFDYGSETLREMFPNLYTKAEQESSILEGLGSANFWADKFLNGAGFMAGAFLSALVGNGLGVSKAAGKLAKIFATENKGLNALSTGAEIEAAARGLVGVTKETAKAAISKGLYGTIAAWGESSQEARSVINQVRSILTEEKMKEKGYTNPEQLSKQDVLDIELKSNAAGNVDFAINLPIVGLTNIIVMRQLLKGFESTTKSAIKSTAKATERIVEREGEFALKQMSKTDKAIKYLESPVSEMSQEFAQFATETGTIHGFTDKRNEGKSTLDAIITSTAYGMQQAFGTKEGLESGLLGFILGGLVGSTQVRGELKKEDKEFNLIVDALNANKATPAFKDRYKGAVDALNKISSIKESTAKKDRFNFNNTKDELMSEYLLSRYKAGLKDNVEDEINQIEKLGDTEFREMFDIDN